MNTFKFLTNNKYRLPYQSRNQFLGFDMDIVLINVIKYKRQHNIDLTHASDTPLSYAGLPIDNCWMRISGWRTITNVQPEMIEIDYSVIELNNMLHNFTARMVTHELLRATDPNRYI